MQYNKTRMGMGMGVGKPQQLFTILTSVAAATKKGHEPPWGGRRKSNLFLFVLAFCLFFFALRTEINHKAQSLPALHHPQMAGPLVSPPPPLFCAPLNIYLCILPFTFSLSFFIFVVDLWIYARTWICIWTQKKGASTGGGGEDRAWLKAVRKAVIRFP